MAKKENNERDELAELLAGLEETDGGAECVDGELADILGALDDEKPKKNPTTKKVKSDNFDKKSKAEKKEEVKEVIEKVLNDEVEITEESVGDVLSMLEESEYLEEDEDEEAVEEQKTKKTKEKRVKELNIEAEFKKAEIAYDKEDYKTAFECYSKLADYGHNQGKNMLAGLYSTGNGVPQDYAKAIEIYLDVANQEEVDNDVIIAQFNLGVMYTKGQGSAVDEKQGLYWLKKAADNGFAPAQHTFGYFIEKEMYGLKKDLGAVEKYYIRSAVQENPNAYGQLVMLYANNEPYNNDDKCICKIMYWLAVGSVKGNNAQCEEILKSYMEEMGDAFPSSDECADAVADDIIWATKANESKDVIEVKGFDELVGVKSSRVKTQKPKKEEKKEPPKKVETKEKESKNQETEELKLTEEELEIAKAIPLGLEKFKNGDKAGGIKVWEEAYKKGNPDAAFNLAICYENGDGVEQDVEKGFDLYFFAANYNRPQLYESVKIAQFNVGNAYYNGNGVEQDFKKAYEWYEKSSNNGHLTASYNLGYSYVTGKHLPQDVEKGFTYLEKSAEGGYAMAQSMLGLLYHKGLGVEQDIQKAQSYYYQAAEQGEESALKGLAEIEQERMNKAKDELKFKNIKEVSSPEELKDIMIATMDNMAEVAEAMENAKKKRSPKAIEKSRNAFILKMLKIKYGNRAKDILYSQRKDVLFQDELEELATLGDPEAQWILGDRIIKDEGESQERFKKAFAYYAKSYANGSPTGAYRLAICYQTGNGCEKDTTKSMAAMVQAADRGNVEACSAMFAYYDEINQKENAIKYLEPVANHKNAPEGYALLAETLYYGVYGVKKDYKKALYYAQKGLNSKTKIEDGDTLFRLVKIALYCSKNKKFNLQLVDKLLREGKDNFDCLCTVALLHMSGECGVEVDLKRCYDITNKIKNLKLDQKQKDKIEFMVKCIAITEACPNCQKIFSKGYKLGVWDKVAYCKHCNKKWPKPKKDILKARNMLKFLPKNQKALKEAVKEFQESKNAKNK